MNAIPWLKYNLHNTLIIVQFRLPTKKIILFDRLPSCPYVYNWYTKYTSFQVNPQEVALKHDPQHSRYNEMLLSCVNMV